MSDDRSEGPGSQRPDFDALTTQHARRAVGGDLASLDWIVRRFSPLLLALAERRMPASLRRHCTAEDILHDLWVSMIPRLSSIEARDGHFTSSLLKYASMAVLHRVAELIERFITGSPRSAPEPPAVPAINDPVGVSMNDASGVISRVIKEEARSRLRDIVLSLEAKDREIILLRGLEQRSTGETARILRISTNSVAVRYHRALQRLRHLIPDSVIEVLIESGD